MQDGSNGYTWLGFPCGEGSGWKILICQKSNSVSCPMLHFNFLHYKDGGTSSCQQRKADVEQQAQGQNKAGTISNEVKAGQEV